MALFADLHCHSVFSDGSVGIEELVCFAKRSGLEAIAITDHDTLASCTRTPVLGGRIGITIIPAVEITCRDFTRNRKVHILCYLPLHPERLEGLCSKISSERRKIGLEIIKKVSKFYPVTLEQITRYFAPSKSIYKQHIMHALMDMGYTDSIYGSLFTKLFDPHHGLCYLDPDYPDVMEVLKIIKIARGIAILAHPSTYDSFELMFECAEKKLIDGCEVWHPRNSAEDQKIISEFCDKHNLLKTGGTDFHGFYSSKSNPLATCITPEENLKKMFEKAKKIHKKN